MNESTQLNKVRFYTVLWPVVTMWFAVACLWIVGCLLPGCAGKDSTFEQRQQAQSAFMDDLREARAKGRAWFRGSGSPFTIGADTHWFIGPPQNDYGFEGEIDFTNPARAAEDGAKP